ncbi:MAG: hypothetical protein HY721_09675 [Planctomycetes bacterium]|nr:hypothetical protein [Planctomycetota bacterium]
MTQLRSLDFVLADQIGAVLYVEGESDAAILREWARVLSHPACAFLSRPYLYPLGGNELGKAKEHFFALREAYPALRALAVLDRPSSPPPPDHKLPQVFFWARREIESYLLVPSAIERYVAQRALLGDLARAVVKDEFSRQLPSGFDPFDDTLVFLRDVKASEELLLPLLGKCGLSTSKKDLFLIAAAMRPDEIHPEIVRALDLVKALNPPLVDPEQPAIEAAAADTAEDREPSP